MKRIYYIAMMLCAAVSMSCSRDALDIQQFESATEGLLNISFNLSAATRTETEEYAGDADFRFYKYNDADKTSKSLIRHYTSKADMPGTLQLLAGEYCVAVSVDKGGEAAFEGTLYYGEADFTITAGSVTTVNVECKIRNTMVKVVFDESISGTFKSIGAVGSTYTRYMSTVAVSDTWTDNYSSLPYLDYIEQSGSEQIGYYVLPLGAERISYAFHGFTHTVIEGAEYDDELEYYHVKVSGSRELPLHEGTREGVMYTLTFKYTPSAEPEPEEGYILVNLEITAEKNWDVKNETGAVNPSKKPTGEGDGVGLGNGEYFTVTGNELHYTCSYSKPITSIEISWGSGADEKCTVEGSSFTTRAAADGITAVKSEDGCQVELTMGPAFLNCLTGGEHTLNFTIYSDKIQGKAKSRIKTQGLMSVAHNAWMGKAVANAVVFADNKDNAKIQYRIKNSGEWKDYTLAASPANDVYTENVDGADVENCGKTIEYQLIINGEQVGKVIEITTTDLLPQVPNSGFEEWGGTKGSRTDPLHPYANINNQWWDSGNEGSKIVGTTLTSNETDKPADAAGTYSAKLASTSLLSTLAAGNIFIGKFIGTKNTTKGVVRFGHAFDFTYRPKALKFWYKNTVGNINVGSGAPGVKNGDKDTQQIYILLCAMPGPHIVDTSDTDSFLDFSNGIKTISYCDDTTFSTSSKNNVEDAHVIGYGVWEKSDSQKVWTEETLNITYNPEYEGEAPTWIMITAAANKYGDYYMGCDSNELWLDEMQLVY